MDRLQGYMEGLHGQGLQGYMDTHSNRGYMDTHSN